MRKFFIIAFILLSCITRTFAEHGNNPILSRLTLGDAFGGLLILFSFNEILKSWQLLSKISSLYKRAIFMVLCFLAPVLFSLDVAGTLVECLILIFLILISSLIFYQYKDNLIDKLLPLIMWVALFASFLGLYDYAASISGLPNIFSSRASGEILGGFRNAGQSGAYFLVILTLLLPLRNSSLYTHLPRKYKRLLNISIIVSIIFLFLSGKIAAYIGFGCGILFYAVSQRNIKTLVSISIGAILLTLVYINLDQIWPDVYNRINTKYETRIESRIDPNADTNHNSFMKENYGIAIQAFQDRPLIGTVLAGMAGSKYGFYEIHSTYFKMLGETGLLGTFGYILFAISIFHIFTYRRFRSKNPYADYLYLMLPFLIGCFISWGYTYHLRKREFWILIAIIMIVLYNLIKLNILERRKLD